MTQGYGPDQGQQGQQSGWGQDGQNPPSAPQPQWGAPGQASPAPQPQWGQASPTPAPGGAAQGSGYPGASGAPQFVPGDGVNWRRVKLIGQLLLIGVAVLLLVRLGMSLASFLMAPDMAADPLESGPGAVALGSSLATIVLALTNLVVSLAVLGLGIAAAVMGRGRARTGGIVVAVAVVASVVLFWIMAFVVAIILAALGMIDGSGAISVDGYRINSVIEAIRQLVMVAVMAFGAYLVHSTATKRLSA
ncbi:hypothetical protein [Brachybacterium sp. UNK5269]|uniref:hypothetical protein n=1 Tax=Brachybacterium sp. UNK5269 TaxID=3408576 RepID=UPI003BAEC2CB